MENFAKPSVLKNHKNSYSSANKAAQQNLINRLNDYNLAADNITSYSKKRESIIKSLENKFRKYNFNFVEPLISNDLEVIIGYSDSLVSELNISLASLDGDIRDSVRDDLLVIPSEITQLKIISSKLIEESKKLLQYEEELSTYGPREKDADEERIINFNSLLTKNKTSNETNIVNLDEDINKNEVNNDSEDNDLFKQIQDELNTDSINPDIFNDDITSVLSKELDFDDFVDEYKSNIENNDKKRLG